MKCSLCKSRIEKTFLGKIMGTFVVEGKNKHPVCFECQRKKGDEIKRILSQN